MGLQGMIDDMLKRADADLCAELPGDLDALLDGDRRALARVITALEGHGAARGHAARRCWRDAAKRSRSRCSASPAPAAPASLR